MNKRRREKRVVELIQNTKVIFIVRLFFMSFTKQPSKHKKHHKLNFSLDSKNSLIGKPSQEFVLKFVPKKNFFLFQFSSSFFI